MNLENDCSSSLNPQGLFLIHSYITLIKVSFILSLLFDYRHGICRNLFSRVLYFGFVF